MTVNFRSSSQKNKTTVETHQYQIQAKSERDLAHKIAGEIYKIIFQKEAILDLKYFIFQTRALIKKGITSKQLFKIDYDGENNETNHQS